VLEIALLDTLGLDNSLNRSRTLGYLVGIGTRLRQEGRWRSGCAPWRPP
jgi:hypothetical protein